MLHVCYSNRTEALLGALTERLAHERAARGPLEPVRLVVPNRNVETYVKLGLAERLGVAANLDVSFLRRFLARVLDEGAAAEAGGPRVCAAGVDETVGFLLELFHDERRMAAPALAPVRQYLGLGTDAPADEVDRRRAALAFELARLFDEYALSRPRLVGDWRTRTTLPEGSPLADVERWQRAVWLAVFGDGGLAEARAAREGTRAVPIVDRLHDARERIDPRALGGSVHLFGISYVAEAYQRLIAELAKRIDVHVYTLNPCREFWEDLKTPLETSSELRRRAKREARTALFPSRKDARQPQLGHDPFGLDDAADNLALRLWGRPGRENVRLLNQLTEADFDARFAAREDDRDTLLARIQDDILDRVARVAPDASWRADGSLRVLPCPGLRREIEVVAAEIWALTKADPTLRLNDVAVVVPEARKDEYLALVPAVFRESHDLPASVVDLPGGGAHRIIEAMELLVDVPLGGFSRREVMPPLTHPSVLARFPALTASACNELVDELGIFHGVARDDHEGTTIERDVFNWDQGIKRLALGALVTGPRAGERAPVELGGHPYVPADRGADEREGALAFGLLVRSLLADARFAAGRGSPRVRPLAEWIELVRGMFGAYLSPTDEAEAGLVGRALRELDDVLAASGPGDLPISYRIAAELVRRRLGALGGERGHYLAHGVTVASFVPMRAIPFRAVFVLGLGHGAFPSAPRRSPLDLREARRQPGDVTPREQDLYMFLETLLCARDTLVLSYVARDELTGETLQPSSVLLELRALLATYLPRAELEALFAPTPRIPLRRYDDEVRVAAHPIAARERRAKRLGRALADALPAGAPALDAAAVRRGLATRARASLSGPLGYTTPPDRVANDTGPGAIVVPLAALRRFLEDPLQGSALFRLRMREMDESDEAVADRSEEPFEITSALRTRLLREAITEALTAADGAPVDTAVRATYDRLALLHELEGALPSGPFRRAERPLDEAILRDWLAATRDVAGPEPHGRVVRFGRAAERERADEIHEPLRVTTATGARVEIVGRTELIVPRPVQTTASMLYACRAPDDDRVIRELLRVFLDHVALAAAGLAPTGHEGHLAVSEGTGLERTAWRFRPLAASSARLYLTSLVEELLGGARDPRGAPTGVHPYLLPCEAVMHARRKGVPLYERIEDLREEFLGTRRPNMSSDYGPVPQAIDRHEPLPPDETEAAAERRFGLLWETLADDDLGRGGAVDGPRTNGGRKASS